MDRKATDNSVDLRSSWVARGITFEEAASMLSSSNSPSGTFLVTLGPAPVYATVTLVWEKSIRHVSIVRRLPRGLSAQNPVDGTVEEFGLAREFLLNNRHIFKFNYSPSGIPQLDFASDWSKEFVHLEAPSEDGESAGGRFRLGDSVFGLTTSTYPETRGGWSLMCDHAAARVYPSRAMMVLCDGCGFGNRSRLAAVAAVRSFLQFMTSFQFRAHDTEALAQGLMCSVRVAHEAVLATSETPEDAGETTMLGAVVARLDSREPEKWGLSIVSVGDVKAFVWRDQRMAETTQGNRGNVSDATDPGGRIGPRLEKCQPDLRNLKTYFHALKQDDIVVVMSDGVHDNFDPQTNGNMAPSLLSDQVKEGTQWSDMRPDEAMMLKSNWACDLMTRLLLPLGDQITPETLCTTLADFCRTNTQASRTFMETTPHKKLPSDYTLYPGKMDHTSLVAFRVGELSELPEEKVTDVASFQPELLGRYLHFDLSPLSSPPNSPPITAGHNNMSGNMPNVSLERKMSDLAERDRFREYMEREGNVRGARLFQLFLQMSDYAQLTNDDDRRARAEAIIDAFLGEGSFAMTDDRLKTQASALVRSFSRMSSTKVSGRGLSRSSPYAGLFDKLYPRVAQYVENMYDEFEKQASGRFLLSTSPTSSKGNSMNMIGLASSSANNNNSNNSSNSSNSGGSSAGSGGSLMGNSNNVGSGGGSVATAASSVNGGMIISGAVSSGGGGVSSNSNVSSNSLSAAKSSNRLFGGVKSSSDAMSSLLDLRVPRFDEMLKNSFTRQKVLAFGTTLGYETCLRFLGLERDYRREVHDMERRVMFAQQIYNHFVSPLSPSPIKVSLRVRKALKASMGGGKVSEQPPLDLFADAVAEVTEWLQGEFYPQLVANDQFMACCDAYFATERLNLELIRCVSAGDDKGALACLDNGAEMDFVDSQGYGALLSAAWMGNYKLCLELLKRGAYVNQETHDNSNIWHILAAGPHNDQKAVSFVWTSELRTLLKRINETAITRPTSLNQNKETALHVAVLHKAPMELIRFLCEKCRAAEIREAKNDKGETALNYAKRIKASNELFEYLQKKL